MENKLNLAEDRQNLKKKEKSRLDLEPSLLVYFKSKNLFRSTYNYFLRKDFVVRIILSFIRHNILPSLRCIWQARFQIIFRELSFGSSLTFLVPRGISSSPTFPASVTRLGDFLSSGSKIMLQN